MSNVVQCKEVYVHPFIGNELVESATEKKDKGVTIHVLLNSSLFNGVTKSNRALCITRRMYDYKSKENVFRLYTSLVIHHLDYCVQVW